MPRLHAFAQLLVRPSVGIGCVRAPCTARPAARCPLARAHSCLPAPNGNAQLWAPEVWWCSERGARPPPPDFVYPPNASTSAPAASACPSNLLFEAAWRIAPGACPLFLTQASPRGWGTRTWGRPSTSGALWAWWSLGLRAAMAGRPGRPRARPRGRSTQTVARWRSWCLPATRGAGGRGDERRTGHITGALSRSLG